MAAAILAVGAVAVPAMAQKREGPNWPQVAEHDANMRVVDYHPAARVRITGTIGVSSVMLTFGPEEQVERVVFGDDGETWEGLVADAPGGGFAEERKNASAGMGLKNNLPIFPKASGYTTMQVITILPSGQRRPYQFALVAKPRPDTCSGKIDVCDDPEATYGLRFRYPDDDRAAQAKARADQAERARAAQPERVQQQAVAQLAAARERLEVGFFEQATACRNWLYEGDGNESGKATLVPDNLADNGEVTAFQFRGGRQMPAFFTVAADGKTEQPVFPSYRNNDIAILPVVAKEIRLRLGDAVLHVYNRDPDFRRKVAECDPGTFTGRPDIVRGVRRAPPPIRAASR
jgi:type IV secretory pathway VirB9-like protein